MVNAYLIGSMDNLSKGKSEAKSITKLSVLGSTGSIGTQTLDVVRSVQNIKVTALAARKNIDLILRQIEEFHPEICCIYDKDKAEELEERLKSTNFVPPKIVSGMEGLKECAAYLDADTVMVALSGMIGILPTLEAINAGKHICQANKESIVCAGHIIMPLVRMKNLCFTPVDSEHSAIYQCLRGEKGNKIDKIYLTCSGGPFRRKKLGELKAITPAQALNHPTWNMGHKVSMDSATLVNKGLEVIEAHFLFDVPVEDIIVVVQPGSIVHSMVQFEDGAIKAQIGPPDMRVPIGYALLGEKRYPYGWRKTLNMDLLQDIHFEKPDTSVFKGLKLGIEAGRKGGIFPTVYNAANEECVDAFFSGKISFTDIADGIEGAMNELSIQPEIMVGQELKDTKDPDLDTIFEVAKNTRAFIRGRFNI